jgi:type I restriction enzyme S subunit
VSNVALALSAEFKETEIGPIPVDWDVLPLGELAEVKGGKRLPKGHLFAEHPTNHPYIRVVDFQNFSVDKSELKFVTDEDHEKIRRYVIRSEDVYISIAGTTGVVGMVPKDLDGANLTENAAKLVIRNRNQLLNRFLVYYLSSGQGKMQIEVRTTKTSQPKLALMRIRQIPIPLPPLPEQRRIAHVLNTIQREIAAQDALIAAAREVKRSLMRHLFTYGPGAEPALTKETEFGHVPEHWGVMSLDKCAIVQTGVTKGRRLGKTGIISVPYLRVANVQDGFLDLSEIKSIRIRESELERYRLQVGDVVLTEGGDFDKLGRGFIWQGQIPSCIHQNHIFAVRTNREIVLPEYLAYLAQSDYGKAYFLKVAHRTTHLASINSTKLKAFPVLVPELSEQEPLARILATADRKIIAEENRKTALKALFESTLHQLMTSQIRPQNDAN